MGRGQTLRQDGGQPGDAHDGFTKQQLLDAGPISPKTFDMIRKAARVRGPSHGGLNWVFSRDDILALIHRARSGAFTEKGPGPAASWERLLTEGLPPDSEEDTLES